MQPTSDIGNRIRILRKSHGQSLVQLAEAIKINRSYLNKVELGQVKPSQKLLEKLIVHFSLEGNEANGLRQLGGFMPIPIVSAASRKEDMLNMFEPETPVPTQPMQVAVNPLQTPVLYTDSTFVSASEFGLVLDVAQNMSGGQQQTVVARIGMSYDHAKKLIEVLNDTIEKNER